MGLDLLHVVPADDNKYYEHFTMNELSSNPRFIELHKQIFKEYDGELVLFYKEIGYQRKAMIKDFYDAFENCKPYFEKKDVERAMIYLKPNDPFGADFKRNFIDNFVEGESIFFASW